VNCLPTKLLTILLADKDNTVKRNTSLNMIPCISTSRECAQLFPKTVEGIRSLAIGAKSRAKDAIDVITNASQPTVSTCVAVDRTAGTLSMASGILSVVKNVHPEKTMRDEASALMVDLESFSIDNLSSNKALYDVLKKVDEMDACKCVLRQDPQCEYWLKEELAGFRRRGMELNPAVFEVVVQLQKDIAALTTTFSTNIAEDSTQIEVTEDGLLGVPEGIVKKLTKDGVSGNMILRMDYPTYFGVMKNCEVASTRRAMSEAFENRAYPINVPILQELIFKRKKLAETLGYPSYSHYDLDSKMAKSPDKAKAFVADLIPGLQKKWIHEQEVLKRNLHSSVTLLSGGNIPSWDIAFCINQVKKHELNVSETTIQEYFPLDSTVTALFRVYEAFFDIKFERVENGEELWSLNTSTLSVYEKGKSGELLGHIILDLFPREGKFSHACCHSVVPPMLQEDGTFSPALSVVLANFPSASADAPAMFLHDDVETFFHEFGHAIHGLMGRSRMMSQAGTRVKRDFVELPSQMLEEWLWEPSILEKITSHYKTGEALPQDLIAAKVASKNAFSGRDSLRQLQFATYSLDIFGAPFSTTATSASDYDTTALFRSIQPRILPGVEFSNGTHFECAFGHLTGYGATYYGYMWSEVFAQDVFQYIKDRDGLLSAELGRRYRDIILGVGGGRDPNDMLKDFLGREPNAKAFLSKLGVDE
jgi:thimet oligopeptidase